MRPDSSIGISTGRSNSRASSKSSAPQPGAMWTIPVPSSSETSSQGMTRCSTPSCAGEVVERALVAKADELLAAHLLDEVLLRDSARPRPSRRPRAGRTPRPGLTAAATFAGSVHGVVVQTTSDWPSRPRSGKRTSSDGMLDDGVVLLAGLLVLRERRAAAGAPLGRAVALVQPSARVHLLEEAPDVLDVRVREGVVVVAPVHPHAEARRLLDHHRGVVRDPLAALRGELGQAVGLDLALRVQPERLLDLDLDVQPLRVEAVLVAEVMAAHGLVALEDVLQRPAVAVVDAHRVVGRDRPVHEREAGAAAVALAHLLEGALPLPELEDPALERRMIGDRR